MRLMKPIANAPSHASVCHVLRTLTLLLFVVSPQITYGVDNTVLIKNVRVFDGSSETLTKPTDVLIEENIITQIGTQSSRSKSEKTIDAKGKTLIPGLIDMHWHTYFSTSPLNTLFSNDAHYLANIAARDAAETLMRGFTTVRDAGGPAYGLKKAIDNGVTVGPRIFPSGPGISQTGGHGDFRQINSLRR